MKVISGYEFIRLPEGTIFSFGCGGIISGLFRKENSMMSESSDDFYFETIVGGTDGCLPIDQCKEEYYTFCQRNGTGYVYEDNSDIDDRFVVYTKEDVTKITGVLQKIEKDMVVV